MMKMKGYSCDFPKEECAAARLEGVDASYKDLAQVCGAIRNKKAGWAVDFLKKAAEGEAAIRYRKHNRNLGHRRELGGKKGRYPEKAAGIVLKLLESAVANGMARGLGSGYVVVHAAANKKDTYPRMASKGRQSRSYLEMSRVELVLKSLGELPKGVEVRAPAKPEARKAEAKLVPAAKPEEKPPAGRGPAEKPAEQKPPVDALNKEAIAGKEHKHELEKSVHHEHPRTAYEHEKAGKTPVKTAEK